MQEAFNAWSCAPPPLARERGVLLALTIALGTGGAYAADTVFSADIVDGEVKSVDIGNNQVRSNKIGAGQVTTDIATGSRTTGDIADRTVDADDLDGTDRSGSISVGAISNGRCITITGNVSGADPGDIAMTTVNGTIPSGMTIHAQRALTDQVLIKACNLTGATSAAITSLPVRVLTIH